MVMPGGGGPHGCRGRCGARGGGGTGALVASAAALLVLTAGANMVSPLYPLYQREFAFSSLTSTALFATYSLVSVPALVVFGAAVERVGPRRLLLWGLGVSAVASLLLVGAEGVGALFAGRVLHGLALGAGTGAGVAVVVARCSSPERGALVAGVVFVVGGAVGPLGTGLLASFAPAPLSMSFAVHVVATVVVMGLVRRLPERSGPLRGWRLAWPRVPRVVRRSFVVGGVNGWVAWAVVGLFLALVPDLLRSEFGVSSPVVSGLVIGVVMACSAVAQVMTPGLRPVVAQRVGVVLLGGGLVGLALPVAESGLWVLGAAAVAAGVGHGFVYWGATAEVESVTPRSASVETTSALYVLFYLGAGVPAVGVGALALWVPLEGAVRLFAVVSGVVLVVGWWLTWCGVVVRRCVAVSGRWSGRRRWGGPCRWRRGGEWDAGSGDAGQAVRGGVEPLLRGVAGKGSLPRVVVVPGGSAAWVGGEGGVCLRAGPVRVRSPASGWGGVGVVVGHGVGAGAQSVQQSLGPFDASACGVFPQAG
ncbi:putative arabinose efflux permease, MFS family [Actinoalloteichus cyanogriseus DSM 43889]|uniref:Arabinose efflux permease, MFS family n=1 Tax=Actinoalloteichus caeruleus DSM 43889 TaxID=1120930 RepID=A0ABT1JE39_ACTCY|nr:putative arabinose efflux permease, MFS family [Actinoalloteichus caeruleus DSM 43889]